MRMGVNLAPLVNEVMELPESADKRDLMWCASIAAWTPMGPELRAINTATQIAMRLLDRGREAIEGDI